MSGGIPSAKPRALTQHSGTRRVTAARQAITAARVPSSNGIAVRHASEAEAGLVHADGAWAALAARHHHF